MRIERIPGLIERQGIWIYDMENKPALPETAIIHDVRALMEPDKVPSK